MTPESDNNVSLFRTLLTVLVCCLAISWCRAETVTIATGEYSPWTDSTTPHGGLVNRIVREAFTRKGYEVEFQFLPWARAKREAEEGRYDASSYWFRSANYEASYLLSDTIVSNQEVFFVLRRHPLEGWNSLEDLKGMKVGATIGYSYTPKFWELGGQGVLTIEETASDLVNFRKLLKGRIDLFPCEEVTGWRIMNQHFDSSLVNLIKTIQPPLRVTEGVLLLSRKLPRSLRLVEDFNEALQQMKDDGTIDDYYDQMLSGIY